MALEADHLFVAITTPEISAILSVFNENAELNRTLASLNQADGLEETIVVNDASTARVLFSIRTKNLRTISHRRRVGVAASRHEATLLSKGKAYAYLDAHQRVTPDCLSKCANLSIKRRAIVTPDIRDFGPDIHSMRGAEFVMRRGKPPFGAEWRLRAATPPVSRVSSLKAPAYVIPASVYPKVSWSPLLRGWGGSEACVSLKAFFTGVPILHLCGPIAYHKFKTKFHYPVTWDEIWRNHALIARICFSERTWYDYWLPKIFEPHLNETVQREMDSAEVREEQRAFQKLKVRPDHEFWTRLVFRAVPKSVRIE